MRKIFGKFLAAGLCIAMALSSVTVKADSVDQKYLALGADLTASQKKKVLELLNLDDNSDYKVITVTNKDEHEYLDSYLSKSVIGTRALSSVTVEQKDDGNGVNVTTQNISYCTSGMYRNALITAGIKNADVKVAVTQVGIAIGKVQDEIEWETLDGNGVKLIFLFAVGNDNENAKTHLRLLAEVARTLGNDDAVEALLNASTVEDLKAVFA